MRHHRIGVAAGTFLLVASLHSSPSLARTWHVQPDGTGDAPTIQAAIDSAVSGDDVLLATGTYTWASQGATGTSMIRLKPGLWVHSEAGHGVTVLDAQQNGRVVLCQDAGPQVRIEGLTLQNGLSLGEGGGLLAVGDSEPAIASCVFRGNRAGFAGAGVRCDMATIEHCAFSDNLAGGTQGGSGGAIACGAAHIVHCVFTRNGAGGDGGGAGGAVSAEGATIRNCIFEDNQNTAFGPNGGAVHASGGAIESCTFIDNKAIGFAQHGRGGAVAAYSCALTNCVFLGNHATDGGAIYAQGASIENCTILANSGVIADGVGGIMVDGAGTVRAVILGRTTIGSACSGIATWICCDLYENAQGDAVCGTDGGGNFSADPQFCGADPVSSRNVQLQSDSPCTPGRHPDGASCGLIGAAEVGCGTVDLEQPTWSDVKRLYRHR